MKDGYAGGAILGKLVGKCKQKLHGGVSWHLLFEPMAEIRSATQLPKLLPHGPLVEEGEVNSLSHIVYCGPV